MTGPETLGSVTSLAVVDADNRIFIVPDGRGPYVKVSGPLVAALRARLGRTGRDAGAAGPRLPGGEGGDTGGQSGGGPGVEAALSKLVARHRLSTIPPASAPTLRGVLLMFVAGAAAVALNGLIVAVVLRSLAAGASATALVPRLADLPWVLSLIPLWLIAHEAAHLLVARAFGVGASGIGMHRGPAGLPLPWLDLRSAWALPRRDHALIHVAGPLLDLALTAAAALLVAQGVEAAAGAVLFGLFMLASNLDPSRPSDLLNACRALLNDPEVGPCRRAGLGLDGPKPLRRLARIHASVLATGLLAAALVTVLKEYPS